MEAVKAPRSPLVLAAALLAAAALGAPAPAAAEFSVGPTVKRLSLRPGEAAVGTTRVKVEGERRSRFVTEVQDVVQRPDGSISYTRPSGSPFSASSWIEVSPRSFSGRPDRTQPLEFRVRVPADAEPGDHIAALTIKRLPPPQKGGVATIEAVAVRLNVRVAGQLREGIEVKSLDVPGVAGGGPVHIGALLRNTGNVKLDFDHRDRGSLAVLEGDGEPARQPLEGVLYPGSARYVELDWDAPPLLGHPHAKVRVATRAGPVVKSESFWVVPWRQAGALVLIALAAAAVVVGWRRRRLPGA
jgi:hypothetical protein